MIPSPHCLLCSILHLTKQSIYSHLLPSILYPTLLMLCSCCCVLITIISLSHSCCHPHHCLLLHSHCCILITILSLPSSHHTLLLPHSCCCPYCPPIATFS